MGESRFLTFIILWPLFAIGYGGGIVYGLRFLRMNDLVDTRVPEFINASLFGKIGSNYKLFYYAHSQKYGKFKTKTLLAIHFVSVIMVFAAPTLILG